MWIFSFNCDINFISENPHNNNNRTRFKMPVPHKDTEDAEDAEDAASTASSLSISLVCNFVLEPKKAKVND